MRGARKKNTHRVISDWYETLFNAFGPQGWWPGRTRFEVITGAILTQNTAWTNVEKAINRLKKARLLTPERMHAVDVSALAAHIRPAGYFNVKARRLKNFTAHLFEDYNGSLDRLLKKKAVELRQELLSLNGIGPETADSILLYAAGHSEFVVDAYTKRIAARHGLVKEDAGYDELKSLFMENLEADARVFNEYHALIVRTGKDFCKTGKPLCAACPLRRFMGMTP